MKKNIIFSVILCVFLGQYFSFAQKELWGVNKGDYLGQDYGCISKFDINSENGLVVHNFSNGSSGSNPVSKLFMASNGKLYGTTIYGGDSQPFPYEEGYGVLFEYDIIINKYRVVYNFGSSSSQYDSRYSDLIEPVSGVLYGGAGNKVYKYNLYTETVSFLTGSADNVFTGGFVKASNGFLYLPTASSYCPNTTSTGISNYGTIVKVNMVANSIQEVYQLSCDITFDGAGIESSMVETVPGKLFGICRDGGIYNEFGNIEAAGGTLFQFNTQNNTYLKKVDFNSLPLGQMPIALVDGGDGKLYGLCRKGGAPVESFWLDGTLFEYTIATNTIVKLFTFGSNLPPEPGTFKNPFFLMKTSNGHFVGLVDVGFDDGIPFKYDPSSNLVSGGNSFGNGVFVNNLIEICRKPSYQEFVVNTYTPEVGSTFTFDLHNDNATSFVWKKGTTILPSQTSGVLNIVNITLADTGVYTCTMTNECGETVTMNLNINVTNLATETIDDYKKLISLYPNPTKGIINLKFPENRGLKGISYKITNLLGQTMLENTIVSKPNMTELSIDTSSFSTGVYQLSFTTDKGNWYGKFVKE